MNELVENVTSRDMWKSEKSDQNIGMNEKFVKNCVMNVGVDPKVVMDLSIFEIGGWNNFSPATNIY